jgi:hypothetical protein
MCVFNGLVYGGSANSYDYAGQDPVNSFDLDGRKKCYLLILCVDTPNDAGNDIQASGWEGYGRKMKRRIVETRPV